MERALPANCEVVGLLEDVTIVEIPFPVGLLTAKSPGRGIPVRSICN